MGACRDGFVGALTRLGEAWPSTSPPRALSLSPPLSRPPPPPLSFACRWPREEERPLSTPFRLPPPLPLTAPLAPRRRASVVRSFIWAASAGWGGGLQLWLRLPLPPPPPPAPSLPACSLLPPPPSPSAHLRLPPLPLLAAVRAVAAGRGGLGGRVAPPTRWSGLPCRLPPLLLPFPVPHHVRALYSHGTVIASGRGWPHRRGRGGRRCGGGGSVGPAIPPLLDSLRYPTACSCCGCAGADQPASSVSCGGGHVASGASLGGVDARPCGT